MLIHIHSINKHLCHACYVLETVLSNQGSSSTRLTLNPLPKPGWGLASSRLNPRGWNRYPHLSSTSNLSPAWSLSVFISVYTTKLPSPEAKGWLSLSCLCTYFVGDLISACWTYLNCASRGIAILGL